MSMPALLTLVLALSGGAKASANARSLAIDHIEDQHRGISQGSVPAPKVSLKLKGERIDAAPPHVSRTTRNRADSRPTWTPYQALIAPAVGVARLKAAVGHTDST